MHYLVKRPYNVLITDEESDNMDPFTLGVVSVGVAGGSLLLISFLEYKNIQVNKTAINIALETSKYGGILYLLHELQKVFF